MDGSQSDVERDVHRLFEEHNNLLVKYIQGYLGSRNEAEEVAQDAYVRILGLDQTGTISHLKAYLYRTARNIAIDHLRQRRYKEQAGAEAECWEQGVADSSSGPEHVAIARQRLERLKAIVRELPPKCQAAFICYKFRGQSFSEIAESLSLTESMIRKYVKRALAYCQQRLESEDESGREGGHG